MANKGMAKAPQTVLLIEDNPGDARLIREMLAEDPDTPFELHCAERLSHGLDFLSSEKAGVVLLDLSLPDSQGLSTFAQVYAHSPQVPIIVLTGNDDHRIALSAVKTGAQDYLVKGRLDRELLTRSMHYSIERKHYQEQIEHQANYDPVTGLPNRNLLHDRLKQAMAAQRRVHSVAVAFIDLDHFKFINDSLGHSAGDKLLHEVGQRLRMVLRDGDTVARLGGDEFVLVLNDQTHDDVIFHAMQRVTASLARPFAIDGKELYISCSAGISLYPQDGTDVETLLKNADAAMYRAKEHGRNNFQFYTSEMNCMLNERLALEQNLRRAIDKREFVLHYQPKVDLRSGAVVGAEALLRWQHPERGLLLPDLFIPLAEETGLILPIGEWVLREACAQNRAWQAEGLKPIMVSVNVSARQFRQEGLVATVAGILAETGMDAAHLEMELTESMIMHNTEAAVATLRQLTELGVRLSVDDFGTGYSSLSYLKNLPIDTLKIDQSFVRDIVAGKSDHRVLARAIISIGHSLDLKVVAEGVETAAQTEYLKKHECDEVQGYYFGRPVPADQFRKVLGGT